MQLDSTGWREGAFAGAGAPKSETQLSFYGFSVVVSFGALGIEVITIHPPELLDGDQLMLFVEDEQEWEVEEVQVATAY